ncbi:MAG: hypothetical protein SFY80_08810 [Verrucomicrobiota bacterium]|nr:hypothetical protein [Verrucomicrobiota bacterium]
MNALATSPFAALHLPIAQAAAVAGPKATEFPIRGPIVLPNYWLWGSLTGLVVLAIIGLILWLRFKKRKAAEPIPEIPPQEEALAALLRLKNSPWHGESKLFVITVSDILRRYIERAFTIRALEQTTEEFMESATTHPVLGKAVAANLRDVLVTGDLVKFAGQSLDHERAGVFINEAECFVNSTHNSRQAQLAATGVGVVAPVSLAGTDTKR